jgi:hypothetical protein
MTIFRRGATLPVRQTYTVFLVDFGECVAQTAHDSLQAEYDHGIEQRRGNGLADDGHANRVDEQSGFDAGGFGDGAGSVIAGVVIPLWQGGESVGSFRKQVFNFGRLFPEFFFGGGIPFEVVGEK